MKVEWASSEWEREEKWNEEESGNGNGNVKGKWEWRKTNLGKIQREVIEKKGNEGQNDLLIFKVF